MKIKPEDLTPEALKRLISFNLSDEAEVAENKASFRRLIDVAEWGVNFQKDFLEDSCSSYCLGSIEGTAHILSCCIVQWFGYAEGIGCCDVRDALKLDEYPSRKKIKRRMKKLFENLEIPL